jgi:hypothetical protein
MAQTNNSSNKLTNLELSIQISLSGLSFCILNRDLNSVITLKEFNYEKNLNPVEALDFLKHVFNTDADLDNPFKQVSIIHDNNLSSQVPKALFNEDNLADYLKFNAKILKTDFISYDVILENDIINVYIPYININNFIYDKFGTFTFKHISTVLIEEILRIEKNAKSLKFYVNVRNNQLDIVVVNQGKLLLHNTYSYNSKEDFIYYILFVAEQLNLNPESFDLVFIGSINKVDDFYQIAYKYIRNITFGNRFDVSKINISSTSQYSHFTLLKSI